MLPNNTLLVVDDEAAILETYRYYLAPDFGARAVTSRRTIVIEEASPSYRLLFAETGEKAVQMVADELAQGRRVAGGFFDMKMPGGIDGLETMKRVRELDEQILCTVVTAYQDRSVDDINRLFAPHHQDEWDYVNKPFSQAEIRQRARNLVSSWNRRRLQETYLRDLETLIGNLSQLKRLGQLSQPKLLDHVLGSMAEFAACRAAFLVDVQGAIQFGVGMGSMASAEAADDLLRRSSVEASIRLAAERSNVQGAGDVWAVPLDGLSPPKVAVLVHAEEPTDSKRKLLGVYASNAAATLDNQRLYLELRQLNSELEQRVAAQVEEVRTANKALAEAARVDALTGAWNRLRLREDLETLHARTLRHGHRYAAVLCDVDFFKQFNDFYGHILGDKALCIVAEVLKATVRATDSVYRYGGEEFLVILAEQNRADAQIAAERMRAAVEGRAVPHARGTASKVLTMSAGLSVMDPVGTPDIETWLKRADEALYQAKEQGRNRVVGWSAPAAAE